MDNNEIIRQILEKKTIQVDEQGNIWRPKKGFFVKVEDNKHPNSIRVYFQKKQRTFKRKEVTEVAFRTGLQIAIPKGDQVVTPAKKRKRIPVQGVHKKGTSRKKKTAQDPRSHLDGIVEAIKALTAAQIEAALDKPLQALEARLDEEVKHLQGQTIKHGQRIRRLENGTA